MMDSVVQATPGVHVSVVADATASLATLQNHIPVVKSLEVSNAGGEALRDVRVLVRSEPAFAEPTEAHIAAIGPGKSYTLDAFDLVLSPDFLVGATERTVGVLHFEVRCGAAVLGRAQHTLDVLAYDEWSGARSLPELVSAFVMPNHPVVERLLADALELLREEGQAPKLDGYQRESRNAVIQMTAAVYGAVCKQQLRYMNPPVSFEEMGQKIRTPDRIVANRMATCLDLAVLVAACLEQAGLHPLLVVTEGHAFAGVWLDERSFATPTVYDGVDLRKHVDSNHVRVFETTTTVAPNPLAFVKAVETGRRALDDDDKFRFVVDVARARRAGLRPIQGRVSSAGGFEPLPPAEGPSTAGLTSAPVVPEVVAADADGSPDVETRLDRWRRKLLDLSLRNRLLNFRHTKKTVRLLCPQPAEFEDRLADGKRFRLLERPHELSKAHPRDAAAYRRLEGEDMAKEVLAEAVGGGRVHVDLDHKELSVRLTDMYRDARLAMEESGTSALYCAIGFLRWYSSDSSEQVRHAPLLLVPVELSRASIQEDFRLELGSDEPRVNVTLLEMLSQDFEMRVPGLDPLPTDDRGIDVPRVLDIFRRAISAVPRWEVREEVHLGFFSFSKFLMWRDLQEHADDLIANDVVRHLVESRNQDFDPGAPIPVPERLDAERKPEETFCPLSADSSQLQAVFAAQDGASFVLKGPPGTGKSQTITNIIAQCLSAGKTVLFVAEKNVALNVVHQRLEQSGLGDFCLELHSNKARKADVLQQLERAMNHVPAGQPAQWDHDAARVQQLRSELNGYVDALHRERDTGLTVFHALARSLALRGVPRVALQWDGASVDAAAREQMVEVIRRLATVGAQCGDPATHPWRHVKRTDWTPAWKAEVEAALQQLGQAVGDLRPALEGLLPVLGLQQAPHSIEALTSIAGAGAALADCPYLPESLLTEGDWGGLRSDATALVTRGPQRDSLRTQVFAQFSDAVLSVDLDDALGRLRRSAETSPLFRWFTRWLVRWRLRSVLRAGARIALDVLQQSLEQAQKLRAEEAEVQRLGQRAGPALGRYWDPQQADWAQMGRAVEVASALRAAAAAVAGDDPEQAVALRRRWAALVSERADELRSDGRLGRVLVQARGAHERLEAALAAYASALGIDPGELQPLLGDAPALQAIERHAQGAQGQVGLLRPWCQFREVSEQAARTGLSALSGALERGQLSHDQLEPAFDRAFYDWWLQQVFAEEPALRQFNSADHVRKITEFRQADDTHAELVTAAVRARLSVRAPVVTEATSKSSSLGVLRRETQKKRRHKAVRALLAETGDVITRLTPCFLMSPISVAQYLAPELEKFDVVIFDEASQIPVWDAVGAMARGRSTIVVGDPKQLPPTNFFGRAEDDDGVADDLEDLESILDDCLGSGLPELHLRWHYRSRHESLIAFSNHHYYDNRLLTFPSADTDSGPGRGVSLRHVGGVYDKGKSRTNRKEADAVVAEIVKRIKDPASTNSIGVVTFNTDQMRLIEDLLDAVRREDTSLEPAFDEGADERILVKNLESIQGDERDVIFFSIGYGPDLQGKVSMNFGPMNREGGQRRLNVAITRARKEVVVFTSLRADQLDLGRTNARGVKDLKSFLAYAERGYQAIAEVTEVDGDADFDSSFEEEVCGRMRDAGWDVRKQVGCSGYRIDLAVVDPDAPGRFLMGVECDGAAYHSAATARDRDKLRDSVLRGLGWRLHRIWSTDWWNDADGEMSRLQQVLDRALRERREEGQLEDRSEEYVDDLVEELPVVPATPSAAPAPVAAPLEGRRQPYASMAAEVRGDTDGFYETAAAGAIGQAIVQVVEQEGPISLALLSKRVGAMWSFGRVTARARTRVEKLAANAAVTKTSRGGIFYWPRNLTPDTYDHYRVVSEEQHARNAEDLPLEEVANAAHEALQANISLPLADLTKETARLFGFQRMGTRVRKRMEEGIELLCRAGRARRDGETVALGH